MIGFYALGGGFGHLTRVKTFIENIQFQCPYKIISTNENAYKFFNRDEVIFIPPNQAETVESLRIELLKMLGEYDFSEFYLDTFPCGILGELDNSMFRDVSLNYLARRLQWKEYSDLFPQAIDIQFDKIYVFEQLEAKHGLFLAKSNQKIENFKLDYSWMSSAQSEQTIGNRIVEWKAEIWLIVHTSDQEETQLLISHAQDIAEIEGKKPKLIILTNQEIQTPKSAILLLNENPIDWFPHASRIFSGAGFNTFYQLKDYREIYECIPFPRKWDDQFWRATSEHKEP